MLNWFSRCITITLLSLPLAGRAFAQAEERGATESPLLEEFLTAGIAQVQEKGETQLSLSYAPADGEDGLATNLGELEIEYGLTSRLQIAVEVPFSEGLGVEQDDVELSIAYHLFSAARKTNVVAAAGSSAGGSSGFYASLIAGTSVGSGEIHSALTFSREESNPVWQVAALYPFGRWRALLEAEAGSREGRQFTPGIAWQHKGVGFGAGVTLRRGENPGLVLKASLEF